MDINTVLSQLSTAPNYVPPISPYKLGGMMYRANKPYESCLTDEMRQGWLNAENNAAWAYYQGMKAEGLMVSL